MGWEFKKFWLPRSEVLRVLEEGRKNDIGSGVLGMPYRKKLDPMSIQPPSYKKTLTTIWVSLLPGFIDFSLSI